MTWATNILLLVLPLFVAARIQIDITLGTNTSRPSVQVFGYATWPITDVDQRAFHITDSEVRSERTILLAKKPEKVFVRKDEQYDGVQVIMKPTSAFIVDAIQTPVDIATKNFHNKASASTFYKMEFKEEVNELFSATWSPGPELGGLDTISVLVHNGKFSHTSFWGKEVHQPIERTISMDSGMEVELSSDQGVTGVLKAMKMTLKVKVDYEATVSGNICARYRWVLVIPDDRCYDVTTYLLRAGLPHAIQASEIITLEYYYGATVELKDDQRQLLSDRTPTYYRLKSTK